MSLYLLFFDTDLKGLVESLYGILLLFQLTPPKSVAAIQPIVIRGTGEQKLWGQAQTFWSTIGSARKLRASGLALRVRVMFTADEYTFERRFLRLFSLSCG